jgi:hypothetical protein
MPELTEKQKARFDQMFSLVESVILYDEGVSQFTAHVCKLCSAFVVDRAVHFAYHETNGDRL